MVCLADIHNYNWMLSAARSNLAGISTDIREVKFVHKHSQLFSLIHSPLRTEPHCRRNSRSLAGPAGHGSTLQRVLYTGSYNGILQETCFLLLCLLPSKQELEILDKIQTLNTRFSSDLDTNFKTILNLKSKTVFQPNP